MKLVPVLALTLLASVAAPLHADFVLFESGHVRPLALSPSGDLLAAVNTPDNRVELFRVDDGGLTSVGEVVVGLEPVAVAFRSATELWVVNHLSDSVQRVDVSDPTAPFVDATIPVGDEPRDLVIAGPQRDRVFVTTARRGQNRPEDAQLTTEGLGRADVWVLAADAPDAAPAIVTLFTDTPRGLADSDDGLVVYAAGFHSGNRTTVLPFMAVDGDATVNTMIGDGFRAPGLPAPTRNTDGVAAPDQALILRERDGVWRDSVGRDWTARVRLTLPDTDLFAIDAAAETPSVLASSRHVGTILFNVAVRPGANEVWVSNLESMNHLRFEPTINGHVAENRITIVDAGSMGSGSEVEAVDLNPHIDYSTPTGPADERSRSLAFPLGMVFSSDGERAWVAAFGSAKVGVLSSDGVVTGRIDVSGGPSGLVLDEARDRLYVMCRFEHAISIVDASAQLELESVPLRFDPEPEAVRRGRPVLYDASASGHGDAACASCHIFADFDSLAWDLGNPDGSVEDNPVKRVAVQGNNSLQDFHPMKGPMTTQSLRGMDGAGPMHWRGDRNGGASDVFNEFKAFLAFRPAFEGLLGKGEPLPEDDMQRFAEFILEVRYPPNPNASLDGSLSAMEAAGKQIFDSPGSRSGLGGDGDRCADCHALPFGTDGHGSFELLPQDMKVAHLRNLYQKVGMFGSPVPIITRDAPFGQAGAELAPTPTPHLGDQVRGFGFLHDGSMPTLLDFFRFPLLPFSVSPFTFLDQPGRSGVQKVRELEAFLLAFPTGLEPAVGQQVTLRAGDVADHSSAWERFELLRDRAQAGDLELVAHGRLAGRSRSYLLKSDGGTWNWMPAATADGLSEETLLTSIDDGAVLTFTAVPPGCGERIALDRDRDGFFDEDEREAGSDPADPDSTPLGSEHSFLRGNCNGDRAVDVSDAVYLLLGLFVGGGEICSTVCDANEDAATDLSDAVYVLGHLFLGGPAPGRFPDCETTTEECAEGNCAE